MKTSYLCILCVLVLMLIYGLSNSAYAELLDNGDGTVTQTRIDGSKLMWMKNADNGLMNSIEANSWVDMLNSSNYIGYNNWRLPDVSPVNGSSYTTDWVSLYDGSEDVGYNISAPGSAYPGSIGSELAYMFYMELGNLGQYDTSGNIRSVWGLNNKGPFVELKEALYLGKLDQYTNVIFRFNTGYQDIDTSGEPEAFDFNVWAVRDVSVVPEPISSILFVTGGTFLAGWRYLKRKKKS